MRLLFIAPNPPSLGRTGSATILYHHLKQLAQRHTVDLVTFQSTDEAVPVELAQVLNHVLRFEDPKRSTQLRSHLKGLTQGWPVSVSHYDSAKVRATVRELLSRHPYDAVVCQLASTIQFVPRPLACASVLMVEDPEVVKYRYTPRWSAAVWGKLATKCEINRVERYDRKTWKDFDRVVMLNPSDIQACQKLYPQASFDWLPYGVDADYFAPRTDMSREEDMILFSGQMSHQPNVEAITYFCESIFPLIVAQRPSAQLWIVGANPAPQVQALAHRDARIHVAGFVPDMREYLLRATLSVCPVRLSYGSRTKVLEAMSCGTPVVTFADANTGIGAISGQHLLAADTPVAFAAHTLKLLEDPRCRQSISAQARSFIETQRAWPVLAAQLERLLHEVVKDKWRATQPDPS